MLLFAADTLSALYSNLVLTAFLSVVHETKDNVNIFLRDSFIIASVPGSGMGIGINRYKILIVNIISIDFVVQIISCKSTVLKVK